MDIRRKRSGSNAYEARTREWHHLNWNQPHRVLRVGRVGRPRRTGPKKWRVFPLLRRALSWYTQLLKYLFLNWLFFRCRHNFQRDHAEENSVLHGQLNHPLCWHHFLDHPRLLFAFWFGRKGDAVHLHSSVVNRFLPTVSWDYSADVAGGAITRQIPPFYHDSRHSFYHRHSMCSQRPFQVWISSIFLSDTFSYMFINNHSLMLTYDHELSRSPATHQVSFAFVAVILHASVSESYIAFPSLSISRCLRGWRKSSLKLCHASCSWRGPFTFVREAVARTARKRTFTTVLITGKQYHESSSESAINGISYKSFIDARLVVTLRMIDQRRQQKWFNSVDLRAHLPSEPIVWNPWWSSGI